MNEHSRDEFELTRRATAGDEDAVAELFQLYRPRLRRMVELRMHARVKARLDASDVLQEALVDVIRQTPTLNETKLESMTMFLWMRLVTGSQLKQLHRRHLGTEKRDAFRELSLAGNAVPAASSIFIANQLAGQFTSVDRNLRKQDAAAKMESALNDMEEKDREIIAMRHYEELSTEEIAVELGLTRSGVLKRYGRALRRLTEAIGDPSQFRL
jgi:RNA polymerase sigma-70 factor (ECF subfamily)